MDHLTRVDFMHAGIIILPGADFHTGGSDLPDTRTIKSLLSISNYAQRHGMDQFPLVVAEIFDARKTSIARAACRGEIEVIASDSVISRLIAQNVRHRGLSYIYSELLSHREESNEIYVRDLPLASPKFCWS